MLSLESLKSNLINLLPCYCRWMTDCVWPLLSFFDSLVLQCLSCVRYSLSHHFLSRQYYKKRLSSSEWWLEQEWVRIMRVYSSFTGLFIYGCLFSPHSKKVHTKVKPEWLRVREWCLLNDMTSWESWSWKGDYVHRQFLWPTPLWSSMMIMWSSSLYLLCEDNRHSKLEDVQG